MAVRICIIDNTTVRSDVEVARFFGKGELDRVLKINNENRRRESLGALSALRKAFGSDETIEIVRQSLGRPCFVSGSHTDLGLSHSERLSVAALVFEEGRRVGVDVERVDEKLFAKEKPKYLGIATRFFSKKEKEHLENVEGDSCLMNEFYRIWTSKEAAAKLSGEGISKINEIDVAELICEYFFSSYVATLDGDKYIVTICSDRKDDIEIICEGSIVISQLS